MFECRRSLRSADKGTKLWPVIIILGSTGQLGTALARLLPEALLIPRQLLDLSRPDAIEGALSVIGPAAVINCAAWTDVDGAERNAGEARALNARAPQAIATYCARTGCRFITFSTDYVFDGADSQPYDEASAVHPINVYGQTKAEGERLVQNVYPDSLIVRTSLLISATHENYLSSMLRFALDGTVRATTDQVSSPTFAPDLARAVTSVLPTDLSGIVHMANKGHCSRFELVTAAAKAASIDTQVVPALHTDFDTVAQRPANSAMTSCVFDAQMPHWTESIGSMADSITRRLRCEMTSRSHER